MAYQIASNRMALAEKLPKGDPRWEEFNTSFENKELELMDIANSIYLGHAYTAWHNGRRSTENFLSAQFIAVDMDTHDERSTIDYLAKMEFVRVYAGMIYTTPSHTPEAPRCRVIFLLDKPIADPNAYKTAIEFIYALFPGSDPNCIKASGFFYGSRHCQIELISKVLPLLHMRSYYKRWQKAGLRQAQTPAREPVERQKAQEVPPANATVNRVSTPIDDRERIAEALRTLDPWSIDYHKWVAILGALHDEFGPVGMAMADEWAKAEPGEIKRMWKSFDRFQGKRAGLGTVIYEAKGH